MSRRVQELISRFRSTENAKWLFNQLCTVQTLPYLKMNFKSNVEEFAKLKWREYNNVSSLPYVTMDDELDEINDAFLRYMNRQIDIHVKVEEAPVYSVTDGMPTSRHGHQHYEQSADSILDTWRMNSGRGIQSRSDRMMEFDGRDKYQRNNDNLMQTGITFCDQSEVGVDVHHDMLMNNSYIRALNNGPDYTNNVIGNADPANDARLLGRRIFRSNEAGVENGIPRYQARLHQRHLDRDISEALPGDSHEFQQRGYDMNSLRDRVDDRRRAQVPPAMNHMNFDSGMDRRYVEKTRYY